MKRILFTKEFMTGPLRGRRVLCEIRLPTAQVPEKLEELWLITRSNPERDDSGDFCWVTACWAEDVERAA